MLVINIFDHILRRIIKWIEEYVGGAGGRACRMENSIKGTPCRMKKV